jgi:hypothetical protein
MVTKKSKGNSVNQVYQLLKEIEFRPIKMNNKQSHKSRLKCCQKN